MFTIYNAIQKHDEKLLRHCISIEKTKSILIDFYNDERKTNNIRLLNRGVCAYNYGIFTQREKQTQIYIFESIIERSYKKIRTLCAKLVLKYWKIEIK